MNENPTPNNANSASTPQPEKVTPSAPEPTVQTFGVGVPFTPPQARVPHNPQMQRAPQSSRPMQAQAPRRPQTVPPSQPMNAANRPRPRRKKKRVSYTGIVLLTLLAVILALVVGALAVAFLYKPSTDDDVPFDTSPNIPNTNDPEQNYDFGDAPTLSAGEFTRREGVYNFLVAGLDAEGGNHTDVLLIVSYDTTDGSAAILSIPRDTYINVGRNFSKLNSYYTGEYNVAVKNGLRGSEAKSAAMDGLASLLEKNLAIKLDYWAMMDLEGFRNIVDIFGGVEIEIAEDMTYEDPYQDLYIDLKAGKQTLTGAQAEQFVRYREGYKLADKGRINAQKIFISAFLDTVKRNISLSIVDDLIKEANDNILTSLPILDCVYFAKTALTSLDLSNIVMATLPGEGAQNPTTGAWYEVIYREDARELINEHFNVYEREITDELFDKNGVFTNDELEYIDEVYRRTAIVDDGEITAGDINADSVDMQRDSFYSNYIN